MIPHEKAMVDRLQSKPFALIGINSDGDRDTLKKILEKQGITWRQAVDGSTSGPIASRWNVSGWPTIYVIDARGVIRFRDLREKQLEDAIVKLLGESDSPTGR
jgi:hypothetical protein